MRKFRKKATRICLVALSTMALCSFSIGLATTNVQATEKESYFEVLENAIFDNDTSGRLTYDTTTKTGKVNAASEPWINKDFAYATEEYVQMADGSTQKYNECTTEFSVTYSNIGTLNTEANILGVQLTLGDYSVVYRVQGKMQYDYSSWLALGDDLNSPFANEEQKGNYRMGTTVLASTTTIKVTVVPKIGDVNGKITFTVNNTEMGSLVYEGTEQVTFGLAAQKNTADISNASLKVLNATGWETGDANSYNVFNGKQVNETFAYDGKTNTAHLDADKRNYTKAFGNVPLYKSLTLSNGEKVKSGDVTWEYEATVSNFEYGNEPLNYYGIGISLMTDKGASLDMRVMYDGRLYICAVPAANASEFGLSSTGRIIDIPNFNPMENPADCQQELVLKYKVNRATGEIGYYVNGILYGSVTYSGNSILNRYALHSWWGGGDYKNISVRALDVIAVEVRDYYTEEYVSSNPFDYPAAEPNLEVIQPPIEDSDSSCKSSLSSGTVCSLITVCGCVLLIKSKKIKGEK